MIDISKLILLLQDLNVTTLSRETGIHPNTIYKLRRGVVEPRVSTIVKIEEYLRSRGVRFDG
jgi:predicted transcriptional regulator